MDFESHILAGWTTMDQLGGKGLNGGSGVIRGTASLTLSSTPTFYLYAGSATEQGSASVAVQFRNCIDTGDITPS
jgi:hypothetical protein